MHVIAHTRSVAHADALFELDARRLPAGRATAFERRSSFQTELLNVLGGLLRVRYGPEITLDYELLSPGGSISVLGKRVHYLWVTVDTPHKTALEGAARVLEGIEQLEVTDFLTLQEIQTQPHLMATIFPQTLLGNIRVRAGLDSPSLLTDLPPTIASREDPVPLPPYRYWRREFPLHSNSREKRKAFDAWSQEYNRLVKRLKELSEDVSRGSPNEEHKVVEREDIMQRLKALEREVSLFRQ
jgi:hypothetical protein